MSKFLRRFLLFALVITAWGEEDAASPVNRLTVQFHFAELDHQETRECDFTKCSGFGGGGGAWIEPGTKTKWTINCGADLIENAESDIRLRISLRIPVLDSKTHRFDYKNIDATTAVPRNGKTSLKLEHGIQLDFKSTSVGPVQTKRSIAEAAKARAATLMANLELKIECRNAIKFGDEIPITFVIRNQSAKDIWNPEGVAWRLGLGVADMSGKTLPPAVDEIYIDFAIEEWTVTEPVALPPGGTIERSRLLTRFNMIPEAGSYRVTGSLVASNEVVATSEPITITVSKRSEAEMKELVSQRIKDVNAAPLLPRMKDETDDYAPIYNATMRLAITRDPAAIPVLVEKSFLDYEDGAAGVRLSVFFANRQDEIRQAALALLQKDLPIPTKFNILEFAGAKEEELVPLIDQELHSSDPRIQYWGALQAQRIPRPAFVPMLEKLASDAGNEHRATAIYALGHANTNEAIQALKKLENDPDPRVREDARGALDMSKRLPVVQPATSQPRLPPQK